MLSWKSDSDTVKLAMIYFIHLLFSNINDHPIHKSDFDLVDSGAYNIFPWSLAVFEATMSLLHDKVQIFKNMYSLGSTPCISVLVQ